MTKMTFSFGAMIELEKVSGKPSLAEGEVQRDAESKPATCDICIRNGVMRACNDGVIGVTTYLSFDRDQLGAWGCSCAKFQGSW